MLMHYSEETALGLITMKHVPTQIRAKKYN